MAVLSKRYVAPLIKALKPRVSHLKFSPVDHKFLHFNYKFRNQKNFENCSHLKVPDTFLLQRHTRTTSRALSVTSEKRGKEVPSEADVVVIGTKKPQTNMISN